MVDKNIVFEYWNEEILKNISEYKDSANEWNYTKIAEEALEKFQIPLDSEEEQNIYDWAIDWIEIQS